jgi:PTS system ascorbate-specific IIA component
MVAIVVIAHAPLASALVTAAQHVYSRNPCATLRSMSALDVAADAPPAEVLAQARERVAQADDGEGVLVLTDVLGATPANIAAQLAQPGRVAVAAGVNLPMLLRSLCYGELGLPSVFAKALEGAAAGIQTLPPGTGS